MKWVVPILAFVGLAVASVPPSDCGMLAGSMGDCDLCQPEREPAAEAAGADSGEGCCPMTPAEPVGGEKDQPAPSGNEKHRCCCSPVVVFVQTSAAIQNEIVELSNTTGVFPRPVIFIDIPSPPPRI